MKKLMIVSGVLSVIWLVTWQLLDNNHSRFANFSQVINWAVFLLLFLPSVFIIRTKKVSVSRRKRNVFRVFRFSILVGIGVFLYSVFWPRNYGSPVFERHNV